MPVQLREYQEMVSTLEYLMREALLIFRDPKWTGKTGAYFCLADKKSGAPLYQPAVICAVPPEKAEKYLALSQEKANRLAGHPDHLTSGMSRNPEAGQWGGAVTALDVIFSMSGLPELGDEALMLVMAEIYVARYATKIDYALPDAIRPFLAGIAHAIAKDIATKSGNPYFLPLHAAYIRLSVKEAR